MPGYRCPAGSLAMLALVAVLMSQAPRAFATTLVGANMGVSVLSDEGSNLTSIGIPQSGDIFFGGMRPGLRLGSIFSDGRPEFYLDLGLSAFAAEGDDYHSLVATANYQHNIRPDVSTTPFVTFGAGMGHVGFGGFGSDETVLILGGGVGLRHWLAHRHGATRLEVRYDHLSFSEADSDANVFGFRFGFDLVVSGP